MTEQYCPNCIKKAFVWSIDESAFTIWQCLECGCRAEENESLESICEKCGIKNFMYLKIGDDFLRFCGKCKHKETTVSW